MSETPLLTLHVLPPSHPCMTAEAALRLKGLEYERIAMPMGAHGDEMEALYGEGNRTVPGLMVDGRPVHGSRAILDQIDALVPENPLYPEELAGSVREAELWGDEVLQDLGRRMPWGALHFRPESMGTFGGAGQLDPAGTDYAIKLVHSTWKYHRITCERIAEDLAAFPSMLDHIDQLAADGVIGDRVPNAADLQIGATIRVLMTVGDLQPLIEGRAAERIALRHFPQYAGEVPAGAFPPGWVKS